jgi:hypothetical protein
LPGIAPTWRVLPIGRPDRILLFMIEYDFVLTTVILLVV